MRHTPTGTVTILHDSTHVEIQECYVNRNKKVEIASKINIVYPYDA
jgi:hypothetical protein